MDPGYQELVDDLIQQELAMPLLIGLALLLRFVVALHPYSGMGVPPMFGDYEAQKHWMEITTNLPLKDWYKNSTDNNLSYWGLDYPPLTAYQSWLYGKVIERIEPDMLALHDSHGYETYYSKLLMRWSVVASDVLVFIPAVLFCARVFGRGKSPRAHLWMLAVALLQPAAVLIDHGHFQYNNISLGLAAGAAAAIASGWDVTGSVLFCLSLNHKQMSMYYAPAFFAHLLGKCLQRPTAAQQAWAVARLGLAVVGTFALCWAPFLSPLSLMLSVLERLVPVRRGLYEDYVSNFWCATSVLFKWKRAFSQEVLLRICGAATLVAVAPSMVNQIRSPSNRGLLTCMATSALGFFLFAYQVHEKSILLALLPITLLANEEPNLARIMPPLAAFSMYPLLKKDNLRIAYLACNLLWAAVVVPESPDGPPDPDTGRAALQHSGLQPRDDSELGRRQRAELISALRSAGRSWPRLSIAGALLVHAGDILLKPPERYPYLSDAAFVTFAFFHFAAAAIYLNLQLWNRTKLKTT